MSTKKAGSVEKSKRVLRTQPLRDIYARAKMLPIMKGAGGRNMPGLVSCARVDVGSPATRHGSTSCF